MYLEASDIFMAIVTLAPLLTIPVWALNRKSRPRAIAMAISLIAWFALFPWVLMYLRVFYEALIA